MKLCRVVLKEIKLQGLGNGQNQVAIKRGFAENFVYIVAGTMDFTRQPSHAALVLAQLLLDEVPNVKAVFCVLHDFQLGRQK